jgi:hypothetical protein
MFISGLILSILCPDYVLNVSILKFNLSIVIYYKMRLLSSGKENYKMILEWVSLKKIMLFIRVS